MSTSTDVRIGDAEREAAAATLSEHFAAGRLSRDELDERLDRAWTAKTASELDPLFADLPSDRTPARARRRETVGFQERSRKAVDTRRGSSGRPPAFFFLVVVAALLLLITDIPWYFVVPGFLFFTGMIGSGACRMTGRAQIR